MRTVRGKKRGWLLALVAIVVLALVATACGGGDDDDDDAGGTTTSGVERGSVTVGSTNFTEQFIVAAMYAKVLENAGYDVSLKPNLGTREVVYPALTEGEIDLVAEYTGSLLKFLDKNAETADPDEQLAKLDPLLEADDLTRYEPAPAEDRNALAVKQSTADDNNLVNVSDLAAIGGELTLGGPPECPKRPLCQVGYKDVYGITFKSFKALDESDTLTYSALENDDVDVGVVFSTDARIAEKGLVVLNEDKELQPPEHVVPVIRTSKSTDEIEALLNAVSAKLTTSELTALNKKVSIDKEDAEDVAEQWLQDNGFLG